MDKNDVVVDVVVVVVVVVVNDVADFDIDVDIVVEDEDDDIGTKKPEDADTPINWLLLALLLLNEVAPKESG